MVSKCKTCALAGLKAPGVCSLSGLKVTDTDFCSSHRRSLSICSICGADLNEGPCDCKPAADPRWDALKDIMN